MNNQPFEVPLYPDMSGPPPRYEESEGHLRHEYLTKNQQTNLWQDENPQQISIVMLQQDTDGVVWGPKLVVEPIFGKHTMPYICPNCMEVIMTRCEPKAGKLTYLICCILCCFSPLFLAWIPCCVRSFRDIEHRCPSCDALIGTFKRI